MVFALAISLLSLLSNYPVDALSARQTYYSDMYLRPQPARPCIQRATRTGAIGCRTPRAGLTGSLYYIETQAEMDTFLTTPLTKSKEGTTLVIPSKLLDYSVLESIVNHFEAAESDGIHNKLAGIIVLHRTPRNDPLPIAPEKERRAWDVDGDGADYDPNRAIATSHEDKYPQRSLSLHPDSTYVWNPKGDGWLRAGKPTGDETGTVSYEFGIVGVWDDDVDRVIAAARWNAQQRKEGRYPGYKAKFRYQMFAKDSVECLSERKCAPVGGYSAWASFKPLTTAATEGAVLGLAGFDASTLLYNAGIGVESAVSGVVALLAAAEALSRAPKTTIEALPRSILFAAFEGEDWGYVGSRRWAADLRSFTCTRPESETDPDKHRCLKPYRIDRRFMQLPLESIQATIEAKQLLLSPNGVLYAHVEHDHARSQALAQKMIDISKDILPTYLPGKNILAPANADTPGLPPSSTQSIIAEQRLVGPTSAERMASVVITDHAGPYVNQYYGSVLDRPLTNDGSDAGYMPICAAATLMARSLFLAAADGHADVEDLVGTIPTANCREIAELFECFSQNPKCQLLKRLDDSSVSFDQNTPVRNAGVYLPATASNIAGEVTVFKYWFHRVLREFKNMNLTVGESYFHDAYDPALEYNPSTNKFEFIPDGPDAPANVDKSPVWTESNWSNQVGLRLFRAEDPILQYKMLGFGVGAVLVTIAGLFWSKSYCNARFGDLYESR